MISVKSRTLYEVGLPGPFVLGSKIRFVVPVSPSLACAVRAVSGELWISFLLP